MKQFQNPTIQAVGGQFGGIRFVHVDDKAGDNDSRSGFA
jgi:hypothetical protein